MMVNIFLVVSTIGCVLMVIFFVPVDGDLKITWKFLEESLSSTHIQSLCCKGLWMKS